MLFFNSSFPFFSFVRLYLLLLLLLLFLFFLLFIHVISSPSSPLRKILSLSLPPLRIIRLSLHFVIIIFHPTLRQAYISDTLSSFSRVVYFNKGGELLQERDLPTSTIQTQISDHAGTSTSSENPVLAYSSLLVSTGGEHLSSESSGTDLDIVNCAGDATKTSSNPTILNTSVDATEPHTHHSNANKQPRDTRLFTEPLREGTQTECNAAILNTTLASTLPGTVKCIGFDNMTSEATDMHDNICQMSPNPLPVNTTTQNNIKLSGKPTSV